MRGRSDLREAGEGWALLRARVELGLWGGRDREHAAREGIEGLAAGDAGIVHLSEAAGVAELVRLRRHKRQCA